MGLIEFVELHLVEFFLLAVVVSLWAVIERLLSRRRGKLISTKELVSLMNHENPLLLDVRPEKDFHAGHIKGAVRVDIKGLEERIHSIDKAGNRPLVFLCQMGVRAGHAAQSVHFLGPDRLFRLKGGLMSWETDNMPLQAGRQ